MKRRNFIQSIAALFGAAALPPIPPAVGDGVALTSTAHPHTPGYEHVTYPTEEWVTTVELTDEEYAALANRRTQALIESMRRTQEQILHNVYNARWPE